MGSGEFWDHQNFRLKTNISLLTVHIEEMKWYIKFTVETHNILYNIYNISM